MADSSPEGYEAIKSAWKGNGHVRDGRRFKLTRFRDVAWAAMANYLVKHLIPREGLIVVWGPPKSGKSFWVWDVLMHIALNWVYRGRRVVQGPVVYIACEGERGLGARAEAFRRKHNLTDIDPPFYLVTTRLDLAADVQTLIADIRAQVGTVVPVVIGIDTLNRSIGGSESNDEDMGAYVRAADAIREAFGCAVVIIHHCGIDVKRPRGHSSLTGAADCQIAVKRDQDGKVITTVEWAKDFAEGTETVSTLEVVEIGIDDDGDAITSCVVVPSDEAPAHTSKVPRLAPAVAIALQALHDAIEAGGVEPPASSHIPAGIRAVSVDLWRKHAYAKDTDGNPEAKRKAFQRSSRALQAKEMIGCWNDWVWPVRTRP